jgi:uncharacterized membrane protein YedE/YeeE
VFSFDSPLNLAYGLATGLVFGFLLQRGGVTRFQVIVGQFLWKDHTVLKTMLTAVVVGSAGIWAMHLYGDVSLHVKGVNVLANVAGGLIFGLGMALCGYCPGTGAAALGDGSPRQAACGLLGMLAGAAAYAEVYPALKANLLAVGSLGKLTFPEVTGLSPWLFVAALAVGALALFAALGRGRSPAPLASVPPESGSSSSDA